MKLFLAVPRQSRQSSSQTVTSAGRTREWVARLPLLNTRESLLQIHRSLRSLNRTKLRTGQRLRLLDLYRAPLRVLRGQVESRFVEGAVPLSREDLLIAGLFRDCCVEMAFGYKIVALEIARTRKRRQLDELKLGIARAMFYLEQSIFACALCRQAPPEGTWQEIHALYNYTRTLGIDEDPLKDPIANVRTATTISVTYRRALLFGLSDPFHQSVPLVARVQDFLRRHATGAVIRKNARAAGEDSRLFVVDPQSDTPARVYSKQDKAPKHALFLDISNLTRDARDRLERLQAADRETVESVSAFKDELGRELLEDIVHQWGTFLRRAEERREAGQIQISIRFGVEAANFCANHESPFTLSTFDSIEENGTDGGPGGTTLRCRQSDLEEVTGRLLDRNESGHRITIAYDAVAPGTLRLGELITFRSGDDTWTPGVIRWIRCMDETIHLGVKGTPGAVEPIAVKPVSTGREQPFRAGLAIRPEIGGAGVLQLITRPGLYRRQRNLFVDDGTALLMTRTLDLIESSQAAEWFECETLNL